VDGGKAVSYSSTARKMRRSASRGEIRERREPQAVCFALCS
jgi:hypothetical protein